MKDKFKKAHPVGATYPDADEGAAITYAGTAGTLNGNSYQDNIVCIFLTSTSVMTYAISNPRPGSIYIIECSGTGSNSRTITTTGCTINATGNNTIVMEAQDEVIVLYCVSATRYVILSDESGATLSTVA